MLLFYILIFLFSCLLLYLSGEWVIGGLMKMARYLGWREFVLSFIVMAFAGAIPNLFVGISSALSGIPQLSFGDAVGGNVIDLTIAVALATLFAKGGLTAESKTVQNTSIFTIVSAILPLFLVFDGILSRVDGVLLISFFIFYLFWLFSKKERFTKVYNTTRKIEPIKKFEHFLKNFGKIILGLVFLLFAAKGIVVSASVFAKELDFSLIMIGILIVGFGNALPEIYFAIASARRGDNWLILGDLMGSIIAPATLVLGIVALIHPIEIVSFLPLAIARIFLIVSAFFFFIFCRTDRKITKKEALFLLAIYIIFILVEILFT